MSGSAINTDGLVAGVSGAITDTSPVTLVAAPGAAKRVLITSLTVTNSHASTGTVVQISNGSTVVHEGYAAPGGGGYSPTLITPLPGHYNQAVTVACLTTGSNVYVSVSGLSVG